MAGSCASCGLAGVETYKWPMVDNIKRDPFEGSVGDEMKSLLGYGGALAGPVTSYLLRLEYHSAWPDSMAKGT